MIALLSPARNMQPGSLPEGSPTSPMFIKQTKQIIEVLKTCQPWQYESLLKLTPELAWDAFARHQDFDLSQPGTPALLAYQGLAFLHLNARDFTSADYDFADRHLRIASALYGLLTPKNGIQPYRLELHCKLKIDGLSLYRFWGDQIYNELFSSGEPVIDLASREYAKLAASFLRPSDPWITCDFMTPVRGKLKTLPSYAKIARGEMARFIVKNRLENPEDLKRFSRDGYRFAEGISTSGRFVFIRHGEV